jgi:hypothetical protein
VCHNVQCVAVVIVVCRLNETHRLMCECSQVVCLVKRSNKLSYLCSKKVRHDATFVSSVVMFIKEHFCGLCGVVKMFCCKQIEVSIWQWAKSPRESDMGGGGG